MSLNNEHAAILRLLAENWRNATTTTTAAVLAGAEALENLEVAKAALVELKKEYEGAGMADEKRKVTYKWSLTRIDAALARLEGK
jgi:hypothetical protein